MPHAPKPEPRTTVDLPPRAEPDSTVDRTSPNQPTSEPFGDVAAAAPIDLPTIPGYQVTEEIARGGMGRVLSAIDLTLDRRVAIKTLLPGASADRFTTEAKITARLPHPNIPPVHELGTLDDGSPYLAMKLIRGHTLSSELRSRTSPRDDLQRWVQVFEQIAQAVGFAHAQGIIHRDLKPGNVMVEAFGEVQVMDWGLAKADDQQAIESSSESVSPLAEGSQTLAGTIMGTPSYMAPEQARGESVDARADVFALGGILTAILTGKPAFTGTTGRETIQQVAKGDLSQAFARLDACEADLELVALAKRCLAADREHRPNNAQEVAEEIAAYRSGVESRLRKAETERAAAQAKEAEQRKRRRTVLVAAAAIAGVLLVGIAGTTIGLLQARASAKAERAANELAQMEKANAKQAAEVATAASEKATRERRYALAIADFVRYDILALTRLEGEYRADGIRSTTLSTDVTLRELLDRAAENLHQRDDLDPHTKADLAWIIGESYRNIGEFGASVVHLQRCLNIRQQALGLDHIDTLAAGHSLAQALENDGRVSEAVQLYEQVRDAKVKLQGADDPDTLITRNNLAMARGNAGDLTQARAELEELRDVTVAVLGPDHPNTLTLLNNLGTVYMKEGEISRAIELLEKTRDVRDRRQGAEGPGSLSALNNLALAYQKNGQLKQAIDLFEKTLQAYPEILGNDHPDTWAIRSNLASAYFDMGRSAEAIEMLEHIRDAQVSGLGADHPDTLTTLNSLASVYQAAGKLAQATALLENVVEGRAKKLGENHASTLIAVHNLARAYAAVGDVPKATEMFEQVRDRQVEQLGIEHPDTLTTLSSLASAYLSSGKVEQAAELLKQVADARESKFGTEHTATLTAQANLANVFYQKGDVPQAIELLEKVCDAQTRATGKDHPETLAVLQNLAVLYRAAGDSPRAIEMLEQVHQARADTLGAEHPRTLTTLFNLGQVYREEGKQTQAIERLEQAAVGMEKLQFRHEFAAHVIPNTIAAYEEADRFDKAEVWRRKWLAVIASKVGKEHPAYAMELGVLGTNLLQQKKFSEAEIALRECLTWCEEHQPDDWSTFNIQSMLGESLLGQKRLEEAELLLLKGYQGLSERRRTIPPQSVICLDQAVDRLINVYMALERPDDVEKWRAERDEQARPNSSSP